ncbi:PepSY1/2 domain-containing protein [Anaerofustis butyriciformans]|uniref:PepSY1/2 domain-containing protein n=1 Tax=Anaerofustis butyriciformans TaxID=3108533 RepID=UPI003F889873
MKKNILIGFLLITVVTLGVFSYLETKDSKVLANSIENNYDKSLNSLLESFEQLSSRLSKVNVSNDEEFIKEELINLYGLNLSINENINNLPINHSAVVDASEFLNKTTNYYYSLITSDKKITNENKKDINEIYEACDKIYKKLDEMNSEIQYGNEGYDWIENSNVFMANEYTKIDNTFKALNEEVNEYPTLIFDGPFSDAINQNKKISLSDKIITKEEGIKIVKELIGNGVDVTYNSDMNSSIECFVYSYEISDVKYYAYVSKRGGKIISINSNYDADETANRLVSIKQAIEIGKEYMQKMDIDNMEENYYETNGNVITINYAYETNGVTCYPDLIKIKVSLTNKSVVGFEATNYYSNHKQRTFDKDILSSKEVLSLVNEDLDVTRVRLAVIPTSTEEEKYCYEIKGKYNDEIFIIYINAKTGHEEDILKVIEANESILTM